MKKRARPNISQKKYLSQGKSSSFYQVVKKFPSRHMFQYKKPKREGTSQTLNP